MSSTIYLDIGDAYTKFLSAPGQKDDANHVKKGCFASCALRYPPPGAFYDFEESVYRCRDKNTRDYLVGWPAVLAGGLMLGWESRHEHIWAVLCKTLFENCFDGDEVDICLAYDIGEKSEKMRKLSEEIKDGEIDVCSRRLYCENEESKTIKTTLSHMASPLNLLSHYASGAGKDISALIVDIGFTRTKIYVVSFKKGLEHYAVSNASVSAYCQGLKSHFKQIGRSVNEHLLMKELELNYPHVLVGDEKYNVAPLIESARWDMNKELLKCVSDALKGYYGANGRWVDMFIVTGGGAAFNGELLCVSIAEENYSFKKVINDASSTYAVVNGMRNKKEILL
ncbi:hypothetical protein ACFL6Y_08255 [Elusimicrobiota bacterium]